MKKQLFTLFILSQLFSIAAEKDSDYKKVHYHKGHSTPMLMVLRNELNISKLEAKSFLLNKLNLKSTEDLVKISEETDDLGFTHIKYQQENNGIVVFGGQFQAHLKDGRVVKYTGHYFPNISAKVAAISAETSLSKGLDYFSSIKYMWEDEFEEKEIKRIKKDLNATYYPVPELTYYSISNNLSKPEFELAYKMEIYAKLPLRKEIVYVDAINGTILKTVNQLHDVSRNAEGVSRFYDTLSFICEQTAPNAFVLKDYTRGGGIETYNAHSTTNHSSATDFVHADTFWDIANANLDEVAIDAHWGAEMTYDYYFQNHSRDSYDDNGTVMLSYVHWDVNLYNAFWDGARMNYGDGGGNPFLSVDISGHEMTHGVVGTSAGLQYSYESGALNESFADIFGNSIEHFALPNQSSWLVGEASNNILRNMANPSISPFNHPDTYLGNNWYLGSFDNGGVHTNSGVQNFWYYLLVEGGTGTNDIGDYYEVNAMGWDTASKIAYRNLTTYLGVMSDYEDAAIFAVNAADDLYGMCSSESDNVYNAWYAVGVLKELSDQTVANFNTGYSYVCELPANIDFTNLSTGGDNYSWAFGDGGISHLSKPSHTYTTEGVYNVNLISYLDNGCDLDTSEYTATLNIKDLGPPEPSACTPTVVYPSTTVGIESVSINSLNYNSGLLDGGYNDYTCKSNTIMHIDSTYTLNVICSRTTLENVKVWVDMNRDQVFSAAELIFELGTKYGDHKGSVKFSDYAPTKLQRPLRMRVASDVYINTAFDACTGVKNGQIEDYSIILTDDWNADLVSVENEIVRNVSIYPNPVTDKLTISVSKNELVSVRIIDIVGKQIGIYKSNTIDISSITSGIYFVEVKTIKGTFTKKVIKN